MINDDRCEIDDSEYDKVNVCVDIEWGTGVIYECVGEVQLFRGLPASAEVTAVTRFFLDDDGNQLDSRVELALEEFPHFIVKAAEKKLVEEL